MNIRYGAHKENLKVINDGFVKLNDLMNIPLIKSHSNSKYLIEEIENSTSHRKLKRFEIRTFDNETYIRATYGRKLERSPFHDGTRVKRLLETCLQFVAKNIKLYDFQYFPDEFLIK